MGVGLPVVFGLILQFRDQFGNEQGILYLAFLLGSAWWSDIGGYFTGMLCGKHKLCPEISPKRQWRDSLVVWSLPFWAI